MIDCRTALSSGTEVQAVSFTDRRAGWAPRKLAAPGPGYPHPPTEEWPGPHDSTPCLLFPIKYPCRCVSVPAQGRPVCRATIFQLIGDGLPLVGVYFDGVDVADDFGPLGPSGSMSQWSSPIVTCVVKAGVDISNPARASLRKPSCSCQPLAFQGST
jgi:hypothetical protein